MVLRVALEERRKRGRNKGRDRQAGRCDEEAAAQGRAKGGAAKGGRLGKPAKDCVPNTQANVSDQLGPNHKPWEAHENRPGGRGGGRQEKVAHASQPASPSHPATQPEGTLPPCPSPPPRGPCGERGGGTPARRRQPRQTSSTWFR